MYRCDRPRSFSAVTFGAATGGCSSDPKKIIRKLHVTWGERPRITKSHAHPSRASPRVIAPKADEVKGQVKLHIPSPVKGKRLPRFERLGLFLERAHPTIEADELWSRPDSPRRRPKSTTLET